MARSAVRNSRFDPATDPFIRRDAAHQLRSEYLSGQVKRIVEWMQLPYRNVRRPIDQLNEG